MTTTETPQVTCETENVRFDQVLQGREICAFDNDGRHCHYLVERRDPDPGTGVEPGYLLTCGLYYATPGTDEMLTRNGTATVRRQTHERVDIVVVHRDDDDCTYEHRKPDAVEHGMVVCATNWGVHLHYTIVGSPTLKEAGHYSIMGYSEVEGMTTIIVGPDYQVQCLLDENGETLYSANANQHDPDEADQS